jgi:hypothetical protein
LGEQDDAELDVRAEVVGLDADCRVIFGDRLLQLPHGL